VSVVGLASLSVVVGLALRWWYKSEEVMEGGGMVTRHPAQLGDGAPIRTLRPEALMRRLSDRGPWVLITARGPCPMSVEGGIKTH
jgi:hypothetical protein